MWIIRISFSVSPLILDIPKRVSAMSTSPYSPPPPDWSLIRVRISNHLLSLTRRCPKWILSRFEDIVQTTLIKVYRVYMRRCVRGDGEYSISSIFSPQYLYTATHSSLASELRRVQWIYETPLGCDEMERDDDRFISHSTFDPEHLAISNELRAILISSILSIRTLDRRRAVIMYLGGMEPMEIARVNGWAYRKADNAVYRGMKELRAGIESRFGFSSHRITPKEM